MIFPSSLENIRVTSSRPSFLSVAPSELLLLLFVEHLGYYCQYYFVIELHVHQPLLLFAEHLSYSLQTPNEY